jgi:hypothetical protein
MNIFIVNQNPDSKYNDVEGQYYNYPTSIPNGKQIKVGDYLIFNLSSISAKKLNLGENRITGIAKIDNITLYNHEDKQMALASYEWFKKFSTPISFKNIGGDPRVNTNFAINKISVDKHAEILLQIIMHS